MTRAHETVCENLHSRWSTVKAPISSSSTLTFEFWLDKFFSCFSPESSFGPSFNSVASTSSTGQCHCRADLGRGMRPLSASRSSFFPCATVNLFHLLSDLLASLLFLQQESRSQGEVQRKRTRVANCWKIAPHTFLSSVTL